MDSFTNKFLEELVNDVRVDIDDCEIQYLREAVNELLRRCLVKVEEAAPYFKSVEIIPCGSMAEGTRIWKFTEDDMGVMLEFDFLAELQLFSSDAFRSEASCAGFVQVTDIGHGLPEKYTSEHTESEKGRKLSAKEISFNFRLHMMKSVAALCDCHRLNTDTNIVKGFEIVSIGRIERTELFKEECCNCKIRKPSGKLIFATGYHYHPVEFNCTLVFFWERNTDLDAPCELSRQKKNINKDFIILIDFLPTIRGKNIEKGTNQLSCHQLQTENVPFIDLSRQCFLVPKWCKNDHSTCWKVSHCLFEIHLLKTTHQHHRDCYMVMKFIFDYLVADIGKVRGAPSTYVLKTAVLYHIQGCNNPNPDLQNCTRDIIQYLSDAHRIAYLPHLVLKDQNFLTASSVDSGFPFMNEHILWSKNRNTLLSLFWAFLLRLFENMKLIIGQKYNFDKIQTALKLTTVRFGASYSKTTFKAIYKPGEQEFLSVLSKIVQGEHVSKRTFNDVVKVVGCEDDQWERNLCPEMFCHAFTLYAQMQHKIPEVVKDGVNKYPVEILYTRT